MHWERISKRMEHDYIIKWWLSEKSYFSRNWVHSSIQRHVEESCITIMPSCSHHNYKKTRLIEIALLASASCGKKLWMRWAYWMLKSNRRSGSRCFLYQYTSYERRISSFELRGWIQYGDWLSNLYPKNASGPMLREKNQRDEALIWMHSGVNIERSTFYQCLHNLNSVNIYACIHIVQLERQKIQKHVFFPHFILKAKNSRKSCNFKWLPSCSP